MEANISEPSHDQRIDMELALREDIGAELDDFLLLSFLGIVDEARESAQTILWRHLRYFPVFAEVADYVIEKDDTLLRARLLQTIVCGEICFAHPHEKEFLDTIVGILRDENLVARKWREEIRAVIRGFDHWNIPVLCQLFEIQITVSARSPIQSDDEFNSQIMAVSLDFLQRRMLMNAVRCFSIAAVPRSSAGYTKTELTQQSLAQTYRQLLGSVDDIERSHNDQDVDGNRKGALMVRLSYLRSIEACSSYGFDPSKGIKLLNDTEKLLVKLFDALPDQTPRGQHIEFCRRLRAKLDMAEATSLNNPMAANHDIMQDKTRRRNSMEHAQTSYGGVSRPGSVHQPDKIPNSIPSQSSVEVSIKSDTLTRKESHEAISMPKSGFKRFLQLSKWKSIIPQRSQVAQHKYENPSDHIISHYAQADLDSDMSPAGISKLLLTGSTQQLSELMRRFIAIETFQDCRDFCVSNPEIFREDVTLLSAVASNYLSRGHRAVATRVVQRWLMLRAATSAIEGEAEWMNRLPRAKLKQDQLASDCQIVLDSLLGRIRREENETDETAMNKINLHDTGDSGLWFGKSSIHVPNSADQYRARRRTNAADRAMEKRAKEA